MYSEQALKCKRMIMGILKIFRLLEPLWRLTSPFFTMVDWRRGAVSSLMLDRKFWEIRKASWRSGWSGWLLGVCLSKSLVQERIEADETLPMPLSMILWGHQSKYVHEEPEYCESPCPQVYTRELQQKNVTRKRSWRQIFAMFMNGSAET